MVGVIFNRQMSLEDFQRALGPKDMERVGLFIDGNNMFYAQHQMGWFFDPKKLLEIIEGRNRERYIMLANWYAGIKMPGDSADFYNFLSNVGYRVRTKLLKEFINYDEETGEVTVTHKANLDIELCSDVLALIDQYQIIVLVSGDGDFTTMVEYALSKGKRVIVMSTQPSISIDLINAASTYVDLRSVRDLIIKDRDKERLERERLEREKERDRVTETVKKVITR